jgi:hypothetical protein
MVLYLNCIERLLLGKIYTAFIVGQMVSSQSSTSLDSRFLLVLYDQDVADSGDTKLLLLTLEVFLG